jgi:hypothetical protein
LAEHLPGNSGVVVADNFFIWGGVKTLNFVNGKTFYDIFGENYNATRYLEQVDYLKTNKFQYAEISQNYIILFPNQSNFINNVLVSNFYNISLDTSGDMDIYYAPFFN